MWERLAEIGIHGHMLRAIQAMYKNVSACVSTPEGVTHDFPSDMGVKQGCALSPLLFGVFINELQTILERDKDSSHHTWPGCQCALVYLLMTPNCTPGLQYGHLA